MENSYEKFRREVREAIAEAFGLGKEYFENHCEWWEEKRKKRR